MKNLLFLLAFSFFISSCTKEGLGGDNTVIAYPKHHNTPIKGATVYVKFDAIDFPGAASSNYDATFIGEPNEDHVHIEELKKGDYYFYAVGFDSTIMQTVVGGLHVDLKDKSGETTVDIAVTE